MLYPIFKNAKKLNIQTQLIDDKLLINNKTYDKDNIDQLPVHLKPENTCTRQTDTAVAFFQSSSPFSNHHKCQIMLDDIKFNCAEQASINPCRRQRNC